MSYKIIIARYNESLDWTRKLIKENLIIYNKGSPLDPIEFPPSIMETRQNLGRESESFFHYIINHYDNLPDYVIFLQGNPFDHMDGITPENFKENIDILLQSKPDDVMPFMHGAIYEEHYRFPSIKSKEYAQLFFNVDFPQGTIFSAGCQYLIPKQNILARPIQFFMRIHGMLLNQKEFTNHVASLEPYDFDLYSINAWCLERLVLFIFSSKIPLQENMKQKKYLVIGGAGLNGSNLVNILSKDNTVIVLDNLTAGDLNTIKMNDNIHFIHGSILDSQILDTVGYVDEIFHFAGMSKVTSSVENTDIHFCADKNILGTLNVLKFASSYRKPMKVVYCA